MSRRPITEFNRELHVFRSPKIIKVVDDAINFLLKSPDCHLPPEVPFEGPGVYSIYYTGKFPQYSKLAACNRRSCERPIYVGKAVPPGWRQARKTEVISSSLYGRLKEHAKSIKETDNLKIEDFACRFMILEGQESNLISTVESELIRRFTPLWNSVIDGFGNHDPGSGRYNQSPSEWDILHPGRKWAAKLTGRPPRIDKITAKIQLATEPL